MSHPHRGRRCPYRSRGGPVRRMARACGRSLLVGLAWTGLASVGWITGEMVNETQQWCAEMGSTPGPFCACELPAGFRA
ncbi:MAG: hypothetical protein V7637_175 [Mycobacteriales bacterium]|jgi:hypothetical protein